eukprot:TRINITY_DN17592_c0_g1_i1.p1 TRINITY_DN17592_c0_g1~~TRINITY_DN17592_c0_g1_i1.p1  ORF type:complete len:257 (+),score=37.87 TRINITY_DN17592_c0_g1_i1:77-847(+)
MKQWYQRRVRELVIFVGDLFTLYHRTVLEEVCSPNVQFLGIFCATECGMLAFQTAETLQRVGKTETSVYEFTDEIVYLEIVRDGLPLIVPPVIDVNDDVTGYQGTMVITNLVSHPSLVRLNTGDVISPVFVDGRHVPRMFRFEGRDPLVRRIRLGSNRISFDHLLEKVVQPLGIDGNMSQLLYQRKGINYILTFLVLIAPVSPTEVIQQNLKDRLRTWLNGLRDKQFYTASVKSCSSTKDFCKSSSGEIFPLVEIR